MKVPRTDGVLDRLEQRVFADALRATKNQSVVDLVGRALHPLRQPAHDVVGFLRKDPVQVLEPGPGLGSVAKLKAWWAI